MPRPPTALLYAKLPCDATVDNVLAIKACEAAARNCGFHVAARTAGSVVLMPRPKHGLYKCLMPGCAIPGGRSGCGITAELVLDPEGDGLAVSVASSRVESGESFISALTVQLHGLVNRQVAGAAAQSEMLSSATRFRRESQAYYYYSKLLCDTRHQPGRAASDFVQAFLVNCTVPSEHPERDSSNMDRSRLVVECNSAIRRLSSLVEAHQNAVVSSVPGNGPGTPETRAAAELRPWLQRSVERCIFSRVGGPLWNLYKATHETEDAQFQGLVKLLAKLSDAELFQALEVRHEFRGPPELDPTLMGPLPAVSRAKDEDMTELVSNPKEEAAPSELTHSTAVGTEVMTNHSTQSQTTTRSESWNFHGLYDRAAGALSQIEVGLNSGQGCSPRQIVEALSLSQLEMKTCAFEASSGQAELHAMDDVMPLYIFVLARSSLMRPFACASFMHDALTQDERLDSEGRAVLLLESAARYITQEWDLSSIGLAERF